MCKAKTPKQVVKILREGNVSDVAKKIYKVDLRAFSEKALESHKFRQNLIDYILRKKDLLPILKAVESLLKQKFKRGFWLLPGKNLSTETFSHADLSESSYRRNNKHKNGISKGVIRIREVRTIF